MKEMVNQKEFLEAYEIYRKSYEKFKNLNHEEIVQHNQSRLNELVRYAVKNSKFYKQLYRDIDISEDICLEELPIIDKNVLLEHFDEIVTNNEISRQQLKEYFKGEFNFERRYHDKYLAFHTSGSTGNPAYIVWDEMQFAASVGNYYCKISEHIQKQIEVSGNNKWKKDGRFRVAYVGILDDYVGGNSWAYGMKYFADVEMLSIFSGLDNICDKLDEFQPSIIMTKPSLLGELARRKKAGTLHINPQMIIFAGEMISPNDRKDIETYFHIKVCNSYSTCETGPIAFQFEHNVDGLNLFQDMVLFELIDDNGKPITKEYELGSIVVTSLTNSIMPVIRYNLKDKAYYLKDENGLLSKISYIQGRGTSYFLFSNEKGERVKVSEYPFWSLYIPNLLRYQVIQENEKSIKLKLEWEKGTGEEIKTEGIAELRKKIERIIEKHCRNLTIQFEEVERIEPNSSGKIQITFPLK